MVEFQLTFAFISRSREPRNPPFGKGGQGGFCIFLLLVSFLLAGCQVQPRFTVAALPGYDAAFERTSGWTGGDGAYTIGLGEGRVLWMFGDTFVGRVSDGRRVDSLLINNSAAVQAGGTPTGASLDFFYKTQDGGPPAALFEPQDRVGWFWPYHGVKTAEGLFLFLLQVEAAEGPEAFGFRLVATWLGKVENPDDAPGRWILAARKIPWGDERRLFGSSVLLSDGLAYVYGTVDETIEGFVAKQVILARVPAEKLLDFGAWRFFSEGGWVADVEAAGRVCKDAAGEFSVSFQPGLGRYVMIFTEGGLSEHMALRVAPRPEGPWGESLRFYSCPEAGWDPKIFCYAAKGHPELAAGAGELIVTYVANTTDFALLESDARLYRPRFVKIAFEGF
ncbi:MAG: DUF4185 domain-containing protein [Desulfobacterales bacterium]